MKTKTFRSRPFIQKNYFACSLSLALSLYTSIQTVKAMDTCGAFLKGSWLRSVRNVWVLQDSSTKDIKETRDQGRGNGRQMVIKTKDELHFLSE